MFYEPKDGHGLPHNPFGAIVAPRPIGWIATRSPDGIDNLAPYSFFNAVAYDPPQVMFASTSGKADQPVGKDSVANILATGVFCVNIVGHAMREAMNMSSGAYPKDEDEFATAAIAREDCAMIDCSRVADAPASLECRLVQQIDLRGESNIAIIGEVVGIHLRDEYLVDGVFDITLFQPLARLGYQDYASISEVFTMRRPG